MRIQLLGTISGVVVAAMLVAASSGCALVAVGAGGVAGYAYMAGEHERVYPYPLDQTWTAVRESVAEMKLPVSSERADALSARLESRLATGEKVTITVEPISAGLTEVGIRIGVFGDDVASQLLFDQIDDRLPGAYYPLPPKPDVHVGVSVSR